AQNEAKTYASREVPQARGRASQIVQAAEAYKTKATADATGQAARFDEVYASYKTAPAISRERIFLETMEKVLGSVNKVIIDQGVAGSGATGAAGVVPVLPLAEFGSRTPAPAQTNGAAR
ncbi:MAG: protease modulator HflK, partial [Methylobacterium sp.]